MASDVSITIGVDNKAAVSGLKQVGDESEKTGSRAAGALGKMGGALGDVAKIASGFVIGAGLMKLPGFLIGAAQAAADDEAATARLHQTFRNYAGMVGASSGTFEALNSLLNDRIGIGQKLAFSDDEVRDSFNSLLLATDDSTEATKRQSAAFDLARGANIPLATATKMLGKITAENVEVFKKMGIEIGDNATEADALAAVQARFGGQADAYAKSTAGQFAQAKIAMSEIVESIGGAVLPIFTQLADFASENLPKVQEVIGGIAEKAAALAEAGWEKIVGPLSELAGLAWEKIQEGVDSVVKLAEAGVELAKVAWSNISGPLAAMAALTWQGIHDAAAAYIELEKALGTNLISAVQTLWRESEVLRSKTDELKDAGMRLVAVLKPFAEKDLQSLKNAFTDVKEAAGPLLEELKKWEPVLKPLLVAIGALTLLGLTPLALAIAGITIAASTLIDFLAAAFTGQIQATTTLLAGIRTAAEKVQEWFDAWAPKIGAAMTNIYTTIAPYINMIIDLFAPLMKIGEGIINGIVNGIRAGTGAVMDAVRGMIGAIEGAIPDWIPHSPSKAGVDIGKWFAVGVATGMDEFAYVAEKAAQGLADKVWGVFEKGNWQGRGRSVEEDAALDALLNRAPGLLPGDLAWGGAGNQGALPGMPDWIGSTSDTGSRDFGSAKPNIGDKTGNGTAQLTWNGSYWAQNSGLADGGSVPKDNFYGFGYSAANPAPLVVNIENFNGTTQADLNQSVGGLAFSLAAKGIL